MDNLRQFVLRKLSKQKGRHTLNCRPKINGLIGFYCSLKLTGKLYTTLTALPH